MVWRKACLDNLKHAVRCVGCERQTDVPTDARTNRHSCSKCPLNYATRQKCYFYKIRYLWRKCRSTGTCTRICSFCSLLQRLRPPPPVLLRHPEHGTAALMQTCTFLVFGVGSIKSNWKISLPLSYSAFCLCWADFTWQSVHVQSLMAQRTLVYHAVHC